MQQSPETMTLVLMQASRIIHQHPPKRLEEMHEELASA